MSISEEIEAKFSQLEEKIEFLEAKLEAEKNLRRKTMRDTRRCPSCGHTKIFFVEKLNDHFGSAPVLVWMSNWNPNSPKNQAGIAQVFICINCGYAELQFDKLDKLEGKKNVRVLEPPPQSEGPHR